MIAVLYEDNDLLVCIKPAGVLTQPDASGAGEDMLSLLSAQLADQGKSPYVGLVHRLDRGVGGVMVFSKREHVTGRLSAAVAQHKIVKQYLAVTHGKPQQDSAVWQDYLYKDATLGKSFVVERQRKGVKQASLAMRRLSTLTDTPQGEVSLLHVELHTGRTHQIRVQCSSRGMPLVGDGKYGARDHGVPIGLWSYRLCFDHPTRKGQRVDVCALPEGGAFDWFAPIKASDAPFPKE